MGRERNRWLRCVVACAIGATSWMTAGCESSDDDLFTGSSASSGTGTGGAGGTGGSTTGASMTTTSTNASSSSGMPPECITASDCDAKFMGPPACGAWACNAGNCEASSMGCTDADQDGYGAGVNCACAGLDCDDADDTVFDQAVGSCYSGPNGTENIGTCVAGSQTCTAGIWSACVGEVLPSAEACNGADEDCNGMADNGLPMVSCGLGACKVTVASCNMGTVGTCTPLMGAAIDGPTCNGVDDDCDGVVDENCNACIPVRTTGNDATADGTFILPFQTVQAAIDWAATHNGPKLVCIAAGATCGSTGTYPSMNGQTITMSNGVSVAGNYESTTWTQCAPASNTSTILQPHTAEGVTFPNAVVLPTSLSDVRIDRNNSMTTAGVTVNGAKNVVLSRVTVNNLVAATNSYGVNIVGGGTATITRSRIESGVGSTEAIGVRVDASQVTITNNCLSLDANGRCDDGCGGTNPAIRGNATNQPVATSYAVLLDGSPGSIVESSALCANNATTGAVIRIAGDATGDIIRTSNIAAFGGAMHSHGVWMEDCMGAAPWVFDNHNIQSQGVNQQSIVDAVRAMGDCHPVIDSNRSIVGGGEGNASNPNAVHCGAINGVSSQCVVLGNRQILGSQFGFPPIAVGVRCDGDGCARVANNVISGRGGVAAYGVWLEDTTAVVDSNVIAGGCANTAVGLHADNAAARVVNNAVFGWRQSDCNGSMMGNPTTSKGMEVLVSSGTNEIDVHSNDIDGGGMPNGNCTSYGVQFGPSAVTPLSGVGIFRNNILRGGACPAGRFVFAEATASADPRIFENNDLDVFQSPTALYVDESTANITMIGGVNALADMTVGGCISVDPSFVNYPADLHLLAGSMCLGAGTPAGAPAKDFEGTTRDPVTPDIGRDEL